MGSNAYYPSKLANINIDERIYSDLISKISLNIGKMDAIIEYNEYEKIIRSFIKTDDVLSSAYLNQREYNFEEYLKRLFENSLPIDDFVEIRYLINKFDDLIRREAKKPFSLDFLRTINKNLFEHKLKRSIRKSKLISERHPWLIVNSKKFDKRLYYQPEQKIINNLMKDLKDFSIRDNLSSIIKIGVIYGQLLMIHPFRYANFRSCSFIIPYLFNNFGLTDNNIIYLNGIFRKDRDDFYKVLTELFNNNNWELWIQYFLKKLDEQLIRLIKIVKHVVEFYNNLVSDVNKELNSAKTKRYLTAILENPIFNPADLRRKYGLTIATFGKFKKLMIDCEMITKENKGNFVNYFVNELHKLMKIC